MKISPILSKTLVNSTSNPSDDDHKQMHEAAREDVERAF
ncbi:hypothetical protein Tco_0560357, partial [Tanacetum coccineum]